MASSTSWCRVCGREYSVCYTCAHTKIHTPYRTICDTATHYQVFLLVEQYRKGLADPALAQSMLKNLRISDSEIESFIPAVRDTLLEIKGWHPQTEEANNAQKDDEILPVKRTKRKTRDA